MGLTVCFSSFQARVWVPCCSGFAAACLLGPECLSVSKSGFDVRAPKVSGSLEYSNYLINSIPSLSKDDGASPRMKSVEGVQGCSYDTKQFMTSPP